ncbi:MULTISPECIES: cytochrome c [unclassified Mesorhizobium]|uniref:c-type cytochrome n=1 Tax=unclassified Mesorhizobium TaxID=325217 RepID=UPI000F76291B|nr:MULTISPECIES: cytochrome c [unclassified Mesorhizobium]AZO70803.1 cytochrome C556 [Mesorhizobium sp. M1D.F.Ca.ET.043.01.1.1]RWA89367.1 MAG: cytochrome C556 [Mesorhizobium sp.]RWE15127.1 MAG: cytochrome C556 [Mesorhizobium sp.]TGP22623.1 cytochrome C556 [Mesorhizobium sp. M1D.F.Ca.ET.231.01.1.1]TGP31022.1 cytochrome C556 [Mesorhizobium sp. M1D.F.Ca.ET.234.01.1.1]
MRKLVIAISLLAFAGSVAYADPIKDRQALMKERGKLAGQLSKVVKGEEDFDAAAVLTTLKALQANAEKFDAETLFPAGSDKGDTTAAPKIWEDKAGFNTAEDKLLTDVKAAVASPPADADALKAQLNTIGGDCGTCHQTYRIKKG